MCSLKLPVQGTVMRLHEAAGIGLREGGIDSNLVGHLCGALDADPHERAAQGRHPHDGRDRRAQFRRSTSVELDRAERLGERLPQPCGAECDNGVRTTVGGSLEDGPPAEGVAGQVRPLDAVAVEEATQREGHLGGGCLVLPRDRRGLPMAGQIDGVDGEVLPEVVDHEVPAPTRGGQAVHEDERRPRADDVVRDLAHGLPFDWGPP